MAVVGNSGVIKMPIYTYDESTLTGYFNFYWEETVDEEANQSIITFTNLTYTTHLSNWIGGTYTVSARIYQSDAYGSGSNHYSTILSETEYPSLYGRPNETSAVSNFSPSSAIALHSSDGGTAGTHGCCIDIHVKVPASPSSHYGQYLVTDLFTIRLTDIVRTSNLTVSSTVLGSDVGLTIVKPEDDDLFTHTVTYSSTDYFDVYSGTICTMSTETSLSFTPSIDLASYYTTTTSVPITFTVQTYYNGVARGAAKTTIIYFTMPLSVKPSCSLTVRDKLGLTDIYGGYVKNVSCFDIAITPTISYGSPIKSYRSEANNNIYTAASYTTDTAKTAGIQTITATVTDDRGRVSDTASVSVMILDYSYPTVTELAVRRCDEDGTENNRGAFVEVAFSASVTALSDLNTATYVLNYKKGSETEWITISLDDLSNRYTVTNYTYVFPADETSSYDVKIVLSDSHNTTSASTSASTGFCIMHFNAAGNGMAIGKSSERAAFDIGMDVYDRFGTLMGNGLATYEETPSTAAIGLAVLGQAMLATENDNTNTNDPNTTLEHIIITNINTPTASLWYVITLFHNDKTTTNNRAQIAIPFNTIDSIHNRYFHNNIWSDWN